MILSIMRLIAIILWIVSLANTLIVDKKDTYRFQLIIAVICIIALLIL